MLLETAITIYVYLNYLHANTLNVRCILQFVIAIRYIMYLETQ